MAFRECRLGMVVGPHPLTAEAGLEALRGGGTAFDAAVAAAFTEAVVEPAHNGVAGYGGAAVGYLAKEGRVVCVDYNSRAPAAAHEAMFPVEAAEGTGYRVPGGIHKHGALSIGVPGIVDGLRELYENWGTLPLPKLLAPAIRAARQGWACNRLTANAFREAGEEIRRRFPDTARLLMPESRVPAAGDTVTNPELAELLEELAVVGLRDFYEGETAVRIVKAVRRQGGILDLQDLADYRARQVEPTEAEYRGRRLLTPPVGCGGVTSLQILQVLEGFDLRGRPLGSAAFAHLYAEVLKACWQRRLVALGDPEFTGVPESSQLTPALIEELRAEVERSLREGPLPRPRLAPDPYLCTSHLCAVDTRGNAVSLTQTHGGSFGSYVSAPGTGLVFGHGMGRFDPVPGRPNSIAPGKRPLHNMAPFLVLQDGKPEAVYGTPGGRTIVNNQAFFTLSLFGYGSGLEETLARPRLHVEEAEPVKLERSESEEVVTWLRSLGHQVERVEKNGGPASGIRVGERPELLEGAVDPRGEGKVAAE